MWFQLMNSIIKQILDTCVSLLMVVLLLPVFILIAVAIKLNSKGAIIFRQERAGKDSKPFIFYKFRTMRTDVDPFGPSPKSGDDPRLTNIGKLLREYSPGELAPVLSTGEGLSHERSLE